MKIFLVNILACATLGFGAGLFMMSSGLEASFGAILFLGGFFVHDQVMIDFGHTKGYQAGLLARDIEVSKYKTGGTV